MFKRRYATRALLRTDRGLKPSTCLARRVEQRGVANQLGERFGALTAGGRQAGEDFPGASPSAGFVTAGEFSGDYGRPQLPFGQIVRGLHVRVIQEGEQMIPCLNRR